MPSLLSEIDPEGLLEYSVVFTDRSLNHMSLEFQRVMCDLSAKLQSIYAAEATVVIPGGGTYAMEAVARQLAQDKHTLVIRNGWFSFRWSQILEKGNIAASTTVLKARPQNDDCEYPAYLPVQIEEVIEVIGNEKPQVVFAPHVETSSGMLLPEDYVTQLASAVHSVGGILVLDCIASGAMWIDMKKTGVDVLISAPQKGWSSSPCCGLVMMNDTALTLVEQSESSSFACDLKQWLKIMQAYENGGHAYHATMPTDSLAKLLKAIQETQRTGLENLRKQQIQLGTEIRRMLTENNFHSVAAEGFEAPGVIVCYTQDNLIHNGKKFAEQGLQIAAGVPLQCNEAENFQTFRIGLFGLEKLNNVDRTIAVFKKALDAMLPIPA